jgi:hypothetical protein
MEAPTTPDRKSVIDARGTIDASTDESRNDLLTELLVRIYPLPASQDG